MPPHQSAITSHFQPGASPAGPSNSLRRSPGNIRATERHSPEGEVDSDDLDAIQLGPERRLVDPSLLSMTQKRAQRRAVYASSDEGSSKEEDEEEGENYREARRQRQKAKQARQEKERKEAEAAEREGPATDEDEDMISIPLEMDQTAKGWAPGRGGSGSAGNGGRRASGRRKRVTKSSDEENVPPARLFSGKRRRGSEKGAGKDVFGSEEEPPRLAGGKSAPRLAQSHAATRRIFGSSDEEQDSDVVPLQVPRLRRSSPPRPATKPTHPSLAAHSGDSPEIAHSSVAGEPLHNDLGQEASPAAPEAGSSSQRRASGEVEEGSPMTTNRPARATRTSAQVKVNTNSRTKSKRKGKEKEVISISGTQSENSTSYEDDDGEFTPKAPSKRRAASPARRPPSKKRVSVGREGQRGPRHSPVTHRRVATPPIESESESEEGDLYNFRDKSSEEEGESRRKGARAQAGARPRAQPRTGPRPVRPRAPARRHSSPASRRRRSEDMLADISLDQPERFSINTRLRERKETVQQKELRRLAAKRRGETVSSSVRGSDEDGEGDEGEQSEEQSGDDRSGGRRGGRGRGRTSSSSLIRQFSPAPPPPKKRRQSAQNQRAEPIPPRQTKPPSRSHHRLRPHIVDPDEEGSETASLSPPAEDEQAETEEEEDMVEGLRMDSPERFQSRTRLRDRKKETANQRQLRKLKAKREGKAVVTTDEEDDEGREDSEEGIIDVDGEGGSPQYVGSDEDLPAAPGGDNYDDEDDDFIDDTEDAGPLPDGFLPDEFSLTRQAPEFKFKVVFHYLLFLVIRKEQALSLSPSNQMYFIPPLKDLRRKMQDYKSSGVRSQVWKVKFVRVLETYPEFNATVIEPELGCDACRIAGRVSKWRAYLEGDIYDPTTHEILEQSIEEEEEGDDDEMEDESRKLPRSLLLGKYCKARAQVYHEMSHWEHFLFLSIRHRYHNLLRAKGRSVPADDNSIASASENEEDDDNDNGDFEAYQRRSARASRVEANQMAVARLVQRGNLPERTRNVDEVMKWMDEAGYVKEDFEWFESFDGKGQELERDWGKTDE
ncbi:hypothetical protein IAT38_002369 [Cryptococcus sp. DSM 104549]